MIPALVIFLLLVAYIAVPWAYLRLLRQQARSRCQRSKEILLTFDDGPSDMMTDRILTCLDEHDVRVAHFVTTSNTKNREAMIRRAIARGDVVACHGHRHVHHWKSAPWTGIQDIRASWRRLSEITGEKTTLLPFRPPHGKLNLLSLVFLLLHRTPIAVWTMDSRDTWPQLSETPQQVVDRIKQEGGGIVLMHDYDREDQQVNDFVIAVVETLLSAPIEGLTVASPTRDSFT